MKHIDFFKLQAKNLFRDYKTQTKIDGNYIYNPKYFDIGTIFFEFDLEEEDLKLMNIQHMFALLIGFKSWVDLVNASEVELELAKCKYLDNKFGQHKDYVMKHIDFFKLQAKNLFRDYKTQYLDESGSVPIYNYKPKYFDIDRIIVEFDWDEENLSLMEIQDIFAVLVGFESWVDLVNASEAELELAKLLFDNQEKIYLEDWKMYIAGVEHDHKTTYDTEGKIEIFKHVFANVDGHQSPFGDYRLTKSA